MYRCAWLGAGMIVLSACALETEENCEDCGLRAGFTFTNDETTTLAAINDYRAQQGLKALQFDAELGALARDHTENMAAGVVEFGHDGQLERQNIVSNELGYNAIGENVAFNKGFADPIGTAVQGWLDSPPHHDNIVGDFCFTGIGIVTTPDGGWFFTQLFAN